MNSVAQILEAIKENLYDDNFLITATELVESLEVLDVDGVSIDPLLQLIESNRGVDFGSPGPLVHFMEKFSDAVYVPKLLSSIHRQPVPHTIWMLNRVINSASGEVRAGLIEELRAVTRRTDVTDEVRNEAESFLCLHV